MQQVGRPLESRVSGTTGRGRTHAFDAAAKRALDVGAAAALLLVLVPVIALVALAIKLDSRGPVFYRCRRIGYRGRLFDMLKFRKMVDGASGGPLTKANDERFTSVGRFLARTKLDELPQLWNVIRGEMSLVGPRPEDAGFVALYPAEYEQILHVKPGISGLCQLAFVKEFDLLDEVDEVAHYVERLLPAKVRIDVLYAQKRSLHMDVSILRWTFLACVLRRDVAVDRTTGRLTPRSPRVAASSSPVQVAAVDVQPVSPHTTMAQPVD